MYVAFIFNTGMVDKKKAHNAVMLFIFAFFFTYLRKTTFFAKNNRYSTEYWWAHP